MQNFDGKVAVITGAASGIGRALAEKALAEGMRLVLADIEEAALHKTAAELRSGGKNTIIAVRTDVAVSEEIQTLADQAYDQFGAVHLLCNNAGVAGGGNAWESTQKDWDWVLGVNLWSVIHGLRIFVPRMVAQDEECHIVNTASMAGLMGGVTSAPYNVSKFGVVALTEHLFLELSAQNAKVGASVLCPGFVNTQIYDAGRNRPAELGNPEPDAAVSQEQKARKQVFAEFLKTTMSTEDLAKQVFDSIRANQLYILTHPAFNDAILQRAKNITSGTNPEVMGEFPN